MSATSDAFARFLDVLAETLDEHGTSGDALAARVHLSRYHFDRLVSAAAGEPPAALRRRVLLERSAYRLLMTDDHLLEVGLEAGYASHEAFTRAFARAYGEPPSRWRAHPTGFRLDAPSRVHFHPPGSLRLPTDRKVTGMDLLTRMVSTTSGSCRRCWPAPSGCRTLPSTAPSLEVVDSSLLAVSTSVPLNQFATVRQGSASQTFERAIDE